jgi:hypothetical protein
MNATTRSVTERYSASEILPSQGPPHRPMWNWRHILCFRLAMVAPLIEKAQVRTGKMRRTADKSCRRDPTSV